MRLNVEADVARLRGVKDSFNFAVGDLKMRIESLKEELVYLKSNHQEVRANQLLSNFSVRLNLGEKKKKKQEVHASALISDMMAPPAGGSGELKMCPFVILQEMRLLRVQQAGEVDVQVDSAASVDLTKVLGEMREQYEAVVLKNKSELEKWFNTKVRHLKTSNNHKANFCI